jgi:hypothetical protein
MIQRKIFGNVKFEVLAAMSSQRNSQHKYEVLGSVLRGML